MVCSMQFCVFSFNLNMFTTQGPQIIQIGPQSLMLVHLHFLRWADLQRRSTISSWIHLPLLWKYRKYSNLTTRWIVLCCIPQKILTFSKCSLLYHLQFELNFIWMWQKKLWLQESCVKCWLSRNWSSVNRCTKLNVVVHTDPYCWCHVITLLC